MNTYTIHLDVIANDDHDAWHKAHQAAHQVGAHAIHTTHPNDWANHIPNDTTVSKP